MGSPAEPLHQSERSDQPVHSNRDEALEGVTEFESESVIATRRILIDADARVDRQTSSGWGYVALAAAFVLGALTAIVAMLVWP